MIDILSVENMRKSDAATIAAGTPGAELMMRAARGVFEAVDWKPPVAVVCGSGNNAGDGYALALLLHEAGLECDIRLLGDRFSADGRYYYEKCTETGIPVSYLIGPGDTSDAAAPDLSRYGTVVDCILGTGFAGPLRDEVSRAVDIINSCGSRGESGDAAARGSRGESGDAAARVPAFIVSVDINSGLNGDTGMADKCVISDLTVSVGGYKPGHYLNMAKDVMRVRTDCDIGIEPADPPYSLIEQSDIGRILGKRLNFSNKGTYGYIALIGGSKRYSGAIRLAYMANAAMRSGAGVVKVGLPESLTHDVISHILESTVYPLADRDGEMAYDEAQIDDLVHNTKTVAFGMGIGVTPDTEAALGHLLDTYKGRLIIDADGLTLLSRMDRESVRNSPATVILTPHIREFSRLTGMSIDDILMAPIDTARRYASDTGTIVLLKGPSTVVTDGTRVILSGTGCPGMATAGSGDVLSGILAAVCAYADDPLEAVSAGAYINGRAGELAEARYGAVSMVAGDTVSCIADAIREG